MKRQASFALVMIVSLIGAPASADEFADVVGDYSPVIVLMEPTAPHRVETNALGAPDGSPTSGPCGAACPYVSLGDGGSIRLVFVDNLLCCSGDATDDLLIHEVGPNSEATHVEISADGVNYISVGQTPAGGTQGIDIDAFADACPTGTETYSVVRITDVAGLQGTDGPTVGADIDSVEALCSVEACCDPCELLALLAPVLPGLPTPPSTDPCFGTSEPSEPSAACCDAVNEVVGAMLPTTHPCFVMAPIDAPAEVDVPEQRPRVRQLWR